FDHLGVILVDEAHHPGGQSLDRRLVADAAKVTGVYLPAFCLDAVHNLALYVHVPNQAVKLVDQDYVRLAGLDHLDGAPHTTPALERQLAAHVYLVQERREELPFLALAHRAHALFLHARRDQRVLRLAHARHADGPEAALSVRAHRR